MRSPRVLAGGLVLFSAVLALFAGRTDVEGCAPAPHAGQWVDIRDESALIVWDPATKTEHFVRRARFDTTSEDFGFLVPTPTQPELGEADDRVFHRLGRLTAPRYVYEQRVKTVFGFGDLNRGPTAMAPNAMPDSVEVLEQKQVAGLDATVVRADDAQALAEWLDKHGYEQRPALTEWLQWYVDHKWIITAFKMAKGDRQEFQSKSLRMTFQAEQPFYPYREPADMRKKNAQGARTLRVYFLSDQKYSGTLGADGHWPGTTVWANGIGGSNHDITMQLKLNGDKSVPETVNYLTEFEDHSFPRPGTDEVYFVPAGDQTTKERPPIIQTTTLIRVWPGPPGLLVLGVGLVLSLGLCLRWFARRVRDSAGSNVT